MEFDCHNSNIFEPRQEEISKILISSASCGGGQRTKSRNCMNGKVGTGNCQSGGEQTTENCNIEGL